MLTIVTHHAPDLDAVASIWLIKRFLPNWQDAQVKFVPAGETLDGQIADSDRTILHVDTGLGMLDHHQSDEETSASKKTYRYIRRKKSSAGSWSDEALERMCEVITFYDHFKEATLPDANADYHLFSGVAVIDGLKSIYPDDDLKLVDWSLTMLDAIYKLMQEKVWAEEIIDKEGITFATPWGKGLACETLNDAVLKVSQKMGFVVAVRKDPKKGYVRIKGTPGTNVDFSRAYESLKKKDPAATWYLHPSRKILLNGTTKSPNMKPTSLKLDDIIKELKI